MTETHPKIAVITVNWNRPALTKRCHQALLNSINIDWHLFIVDNGSTDDSVSELNNLGKKTSLIITGKNTGWAGGNNRGIQEAVDRGFEWLFLLNNDATVEPETLYELWRASTNHSPPAISGAVQLDDDELACFFGAKERPGSVFPIDIKADEFAKQSEVFETQFIKGAALLCHASHIQAIGFFDKRFFLNFEEVDWCLRAKLAGFFVIMSKRAIVRHEGSGSMGGYSSPMSTYFLVRNAILFAEIHGGPKHQVKAIFNRLNWARLQFGTKSWIIAAVCVVCSRSAWSIAWKLGLRDYILRRFGDCPPIIRSLTFGKPAQSPADEITN